MIFDHLLSFLTNIEEFQRILSSLKGATREELISGIASSQRSYLIASLYRLMDDKNIIVLTSNSRQAELWHNDLCTFLSPNEVLIFPPIEIMAHEGTEGNTELLSKRAIVIEHLREGKKSVIIVPANSLVQKLIPYEVYEKNVITLKSGREYNRDTLLLQLTSIGYDKVDLVEEKGDFSVRGGIIDIFPLTNTLPVRIEFFGDEIESIRLFDLYTQRSIRNVELVTITPAVEGFIPNAHRENGVKRIEQEATELLNGLRKIGKRKERQVLQEKLLADLERLREGICFNGVSSYKPYFHKRLETILDYFHEAFLVLDEPARFGEEIQNLSLQFGETHGSLLEHGSVLPGQFDNYADYDELLREIRLRKSLSLTLLQEGVNDFFIHSLRRSLPFKSSPLFHGKINTFIEEIKEWRREGNKIVIFLSNEERLKRLRQILRESDIGSIVAKDNDFQWDEREILLTLGSLDSGFIINDLVVLTDSDIFGKRRSIAKSRLPKTAGKRLESFTDLKRGDFVVHVNHGIGKYHGIETMEVAGTQRDFLVLQYAGDDRLYVPAEQVDMLQKYIGMDDASPKLHKLGGTEWSKAKSRVKESVREMAKELLELYATRQTVKGYAFSPDTPWQQEFEETFPYEETPGQWAAIEDIKRDMESERPMDRLLCGDVGYGKTEVAIRAAFKATMDNKQVAVLVPTTILAQQHYNTFSERFENYPVTIKLLSRFQTSAEQREIIKGLKAGTVDIVIGTHRLIQKDVEFKNIGLVIIDEEQRFGVAQKERLKELRKNVDVLTLTATPIPRTLHMSIVGVRDISVIETPPEDRFPIRTYVLPYNEDVIREGIYRELNRGGQVYFVHNRVENIHSVAATIERLVPDAKVGIAHGQLSENRLERVMLQFLKGEYDVLVCTTIIETGLDIQNVNTLFVADADRMGLAQLYQLRGRVGRTNKVAYAYLMYKEDKILREDAEKRLQAIKEFVELGSGFKIAMRDLEIRGAGNILGPEQHGHIASVGFEMYCRLLEDEVKKLKGESILKQPEPSVDLALDAFISDRYITDSKQKIEIYKKIIAIETLEDAKEIENEVEDRFGAPPLAFRNLLTVARLKIISKELGIACIKQGDKTVLIKFFPGVEVSRAVISRFVRPYLGKLHISFNGPQELKVWVRDLPGGVYIQVIERLLMELMTKEKVAIG